MTQRKADHIAESGRMVERIAESAQNVSDSDLISRKSTIDSIRECAETARDNREWDMEQGYLNAIECVEEEPSAQPDNQINLCDSCDYLYPDCPAKYDDVIFGNGIGNDNICACNKYKPFAQPEQRWIPCSERLPEESGKYLVTVLAGIGKRTTSAPYHLRSKSWTLTGRMAYWKVIAWMPLPEPYRGGEK